MKDLIIEKLMEHRFSGMDLIGIEYAELEDAYNYLYTLSNQELLELLIYWKYE